MNTTIEFLDALKAKTGAASDYALHKILGCSKQAISRYRNGIDFFSDEMCLKVASILEISPALVFAAVHAERAKSEPEKAVWKSIFEKLGGMAAAVAVGIMLSAPTPSQASNGAGSKVCHNSDHSIHYTKRRKKKRSINPLAFLVNQLVPA